jgi:hypothetical protein
MKGPKDINVQTHVQVDAREVGVKEGIESG